MQTGTIVALVRSRIFYYLSVTLLLAAIVVAFVTKAYEVAVTRCHLGTRMEIDHLIQCAVHWRILGYVVVSLAILSWGFALWRHEKLCWGCAIVLLGLYVLLDLMLV
jgi:hypothetical protein